MTPARLALLSASRILLDLTFPAEDYLRAVAPFEMLAGDLDRAKQIGQESGCGLVRMAVEDAVFVMPPRGLYKDGSAFERIYDRAGGSPWAPGGACRLATLEAPPQPGDGIVWGPSGNAVAHVDACVERVDGARSNLVLTVIAGGQRDEHGNETVKRLKRQVRWRGGYWIDAATGRAILSVLDADAMAARHGLLDTGSEAG